jgi:hypothetical protein
MMYGRGPNFAVRRGVTQKSRKPPTFFLGFANRTFLLRLAVALLFLHPVTAFFSQAGELGYCTWLP